MVLALKIEMISSRKNPVVRDAASLLQKAEKRSEAGLFIAEGARLCADAARSDICIDTCFFTEAARKKYANYLEQILTKCSRAFCVEEHVAALLSDTRNPQGIFCVCKMPEIRSMTLHEDDHILVLENMQDPSNMGNVLRTAEALGINKLVMVDACCDIYAPKVLRGSMGAVFRLSVERYPDAKTCFEALNCRGVTSLASVPDSSVAPITSFDFVRGKWAVWIGNEGNGLTETAKKLCDERVTIPMLGRAESFNASTAAAIVMWEMMRGIGKDRKHNG